MGNVLESFASGIAKSIGNLFSAPLDFLSGKSCSSICGPTWDFICYVEHFCVANLLKLGLIILVIYIALLFLYLSQKLGIFYCICHTLCNTARGCFAICFNIWGHICHLHTRRRWLRKNYNENAGEIKELDQTPRRNDHVDTCHSSDASELGVITRRASYDRRKEHRRSHWKRSLRPRNHRVQLEISHLGSSRHFRKHRRRDHPVSSVHHVRVTHASRFANKSKSCSNRIVARRDKG